MCGCQTRKRSRRHKSDDIQFLDSVFVFKELTDHLRDFLVLLQSFGVSVTGRVDNSQRIRNAESFRVMDVVGRDFTRLAVDLRPAGNLLLNQLKTERVVPFDVENVIYHSVDQRRLTRSGGAHHQNRPVLHPAFFVISFAENETLGRRSSSGCQRNSVQVQSVPIVNLFASFYNHFGETDFIVGCCHGNRFTGLALLLSVLRHGHYLNRVGRFRLKFF